MLLAGLTGRQVTVLRAYAKYLRQVGTTFSQRYIESTLAAHPAIARKLIELFALRFDPAPPERARAGEPSTWPTSCEPTSTPSPASTRTASCARSSRLIEATLRTNAYRAGADGRPRPWLSFKLDPAKCARPARCPGRRYEIWVYSPRVEGVHLRGGAVARGGIRWSDRMEDFRTEVLGLMKAQMVKNAVIVPVGAKGGFVVKQPPADRGAAARRGRGTRYRTFIRGLLDVTDNIVDGEVVPPPQVVRHDGDDPYLVVAADKGTATFSDLANGLAAEYGFWLGDAFASGGSSGYDHKEMGITARRAPGRASGATSTGSASTPTPRRSPSSASATCPATCSATACCSASACGWWPPSTTATSSSTPTPTRRWRAPSASGCSTCPARRGTTTTAR